MCVCNVFVMCEQVEAGTSLPVWVSHDATRISFSFSAPLPPDED
jgi:hypothetical protein